MVALFSVALNLNSATVQPSLKPDGDLMKFSTTLYCLALTVLAAACGPNPNSPYTQPYYAPWPVVPVSQQPVIPMYQQPLLVPQQRVTTERRTTVAPVPVQPAQQVRATMQPSVQQQPVAPTTQNLSDRAGAVRQFQVQQGVQQKATGFGARPVVAAPKPFVAPAQRPATQFRKPSR